MKFGPGKGFRLSEPTLAHFEREKTNYVECDASDTATDGSLYQIKYDGELHQIAFFSKAMSAADREYAKELEFEFGEKVDKFHKR